MKLMNGLYCFAAVLILFAIIGYGMNIYKLVVTCDFEAPYKCEVIRTVGLVPFVGMFTGWMDLGK